MEETEKILLQIDLDRFISVREIFEAKNLARVVSYIEIKAKTHTEEIFYNDYIKFEILSEK